VSATPLNRQGEFTETIALSGSTSASGAFSVTVTKARNITNVKSAYLVGTSLLYALRVTGWSGNTINLQLLAASGAAAGGAPFEVPAAVNHSFWFRHSNLRGVLIEQLRNELRLVCAFGIINI